MSDKQEAEIAARALEAVATLISAAAEAAISAVEKRLGGDRTQHGGYCASVSNASLCRAFAAELRANESTLEALETIAGKAKEISDGVIEQVDAELDNMSAKH